MRPPTMIAIPNLQPGGRLSWILPPPFPGEMSDAWGLRVLRYIVDTRSVDARLTDADLRWADAAAQRYAITARDQDGRASTLERHQLVTVAAFSEARTWIQTTAARRTRTAQDGPGAAQPPVGGKQPGRPAPLNPAPPKGPSQGTQANAPRRLQETETTLQPTGAGSALDRW